MAQQHLRNILTYVDVPTLGQPEAFFHAKEELFDMPVTSVRIAAKSCATEMDHLRCG